MPQKQSLFIALSFFIIKMYGSNVAKIPITIKSKFPLSSAGIIFSTTQAISRTFPLVEGYLDQSNFGGNKNGTTYIPFSISGALIINDNCKALALQPDGKIIVAGYTTNGTATYFALARYLTNGQLDPSFGQSGTRAGTQYIPFSISGTATALTCDQIAAVAVQPDGKIVVAGLSTNTTTKKPCYCAIARFTSSGQIDTSFGQSGTRAGTQYISFSICNAANVYDQATTIALQPDGKIIIAGLTTNSTQLPCYAAIARFTSAGKLDTSFGQTGSRAGTQYIPFSISKVTTTGNINDQITSILVQSDGKIVTAGSSNTKTTLPCYYAVARFTTSGQLDTSFGQSSTYAGTNYIPFSISGATTINDQSLATGMQSDGSIILGGSTQNLTASFCALARFTSTGQLDSTFGQTGLRAGTTYVPFNIANQATTYDYITSLTIQSDNSIITTGFSSNTTNITTNNYTAYITTARFTVNGSLDQNFGKIGTAQAGTTYIPFSAANTTTKSDVAYALGLESKGNILLAGSTKTSNASYFCAARFINLAPSAPTRLTYGL